MNTKAPQNRPQTTIRPNPKRTQAQATTTPGPIARRRRHRRTTQLEPAAAACIAPMLVDGGTSFVCRIPLTPDPHFAAALTQAADHQGQRIQLDVAPGISAQVTARVDAVGQIWTVRLADVAHLTVREGGEVWVQAKARALWAEGLRGWLDTWLVAITRWAWGVDLAPGEAQAFGWRVTRYEICSDFTGLVFGHRDGEKFKGPRRPRPERGHDNGLGYDDNPGTVGTQGATITIGNRSRPTALCVYRKTEEIAARAKSKGDDDSVYRATWEACGWNGEAEVQRVEYRISGDALSLRDSDGTLGLRDPYALTDTRTLASLWAHLTVKHELKAPRTPRQRLREAPTDPRWLVVQGAAGGVPKPIGWRQDRIAARGAHLCANNRAHLALRQANAADERAFFWTHGRPANGTAELERWAVQRIRARDPVERLAHQRVMVGNATVDPVMRAELERRQAWYGQAALLSEADGAQSEAKVPEPEDFPAIDSQREPVACGEVLSTPQAPRPARSKARERQRPARLARRAELEAELEADANPPQDPEAVAITARAWLAAASEDADTESVADSGQLIRT